MGCVWGGGYICLCGFGVLEGWECIGNTEKLEWIIWLIWAIVGKVHGQNDSKMCDKWVFLSLQWPTMAQMSQMIHSGFSVKEGEEKQHHYIIFVTLSSLVHEKNLSHQPDKDD